LHAELRWNVSVSQSKNVIRELVFLLAQFFLLGWKGQEFK